MCVLMRSAGPQTPRGPALQELSGLPTSSETGSPAGAALPGRVAVEVFGSGSGEFGAPAACDAFGPSAPGAPRYRAIRKAQSNTAKMLVIWLPVRPNTQRLSTRR